MKPTGKVFRTVFLSALLLVVVLVLGSGTAFAEGEAATSTPSVGPAPTVSFVEEGPLELDPAAVKKAVEAGALEIKVHNAANAPQQVTVEVVGTKGSDPAIEALFAGASETSELAGGATGAVSLPLAQQPLDPAKKTYSLGLVASGATGGLARRGLTVSYSEPPPPENSLSPNRPIDVTLHAVNFLPSLLSSLLGFGVFVALTLCLVAAVFWKWLDHKLRCLPCMLIAVAAVIGALCLFGAIEDGPWEQPSLHAISSRPIKLAPEVPEGTLGTVSAEDGSIAQLISKDHNLRPEHLDGAEKLTGRYSLEGKHEKAEAAATVDVRDYWIWAVGAIAFGLWIGYLLRRWFKVLQPRMTVEAQLDRAGKDYERQIKVLSENDAGREYVHVTIDRRVDAWKEEIERLNKEGESAKAAEKIIALRAYVGRFVEYREMLRKLDGACLGLEQIGRLELLHFPLEESSGYIEAKAIRDALIDSPALDSDEEELKERIAAVKGQTTLIQAIATDVKWAIRHILTVREALRKKSDEGTLTADEEAKLKSVEAELFKAAVMMLQATSTESLAEAKTVDNAAVLAFESLIRPADPKQPRRKYKVALTRSLMPPEQQSTIQFADAAEVTFTLAEGEGDILAAEKELPLVVEVSHDIEDQKSKAGEAVHVDDRVRFDISFKPAIPRSLEEVEIEFGDGGRPERYELPRAGDRFVVSHHFRGKGDGNFVIRRVGATEPLKAYSVGKVEDPRPLDSETKLTDFEKVVTTGAFILAVASGMSVLYFADPSWGQPMDYLAAIVWGGATGEGVKLAAAIADRAWPES